MWDRKEEATACHHGCFPSLKSTEAVSNRLKSLRYSDFVQGCRTVLCGEQWYLPIVEYKGVSWSVFEKNVESHVILLGKYRQSLGSHCD